MHSRFSTFLCTLRYLRPIQIRYRAYYSLRNFFVLKKRYYPSSAIRGYCLSFDPFLPAFHSINNYNEFYFLNNQWSFHDRIDWNFNGYGKLWNYNLNYFDFLLQDNIDTAYAYKLVADYCIMINEIRDGLEPYPVSLRGINWIKFLSINNIRDTHIDDCLYYQYICLRNNLEYHLMGNHLIENGFSLLFASYYFRSDDFYKKAKTIITNELNEQILKDGGHFELSTMYHNIILYHLLDALNLVKNNSWKDHELFDLLKGKACLMMNWSTTISWNDGTIPQVNDAANYIAPTTKDLLNYASSFGIDKCKSRLTDSGYRKFENEKFEAIMDVGKIGPDYQPGHSHSDALSFEIRIKGKPIIVDTGTSTYEIGKRRSIERSTFAHNTVEIDDMNQSEVWASHRVGRRASVTIHNDDSKTCCASHNGYKKLGITHMRTFKFDEYSTFNIEDTLLGNHSSNKAVASFHFHPDVNLIITANKVVVNNDVTIFFENGDNMVACEYLYAPEFNKLIRAQCLKVTFHSQLKTRIEF